MDIFEAKNVLVVDDEPALREILVDEFLYHNSNVLEAEGGIQAIEILESRPIDVVVSDVRMPKGDGVYLLKEMQKRNLCPVTFMVTGFADLTPEQAMALGATALLPKPYDIDELFESIRKTLIQKSHKAG